jgi:hypothetical protein
MDDYLFGPDDAERKVVRNLKRRKRKHNLFVKRVEGMKAKWDREELAYLRAKVQQQAASIELDRQWIARQNEIEQERRQREAEVEKIRSYYETEQDKERKARLDRLTKQINKETNARDRRVLEGKGLVRGRRK